MSTYAVSELVKEVKVLLDRNQETSGLLTPTDTDTLSQGELIQSKIVDAARIILKDAPASMLDGRTFNELMEVEKRLLQSLQTLNPHLGG